jgi:CheY-like chemotaxis protein
LPKRGYKFLVVEDEAMVLMLIEDMLDELGHSVVASATRLREALDLARTSDVELAILDVNLAGEISYPVADILKTRSIPFLFSSGYDLGGLDPEYRDAPVVPKPFQMGSLDAAIELAMAKGVK